MKNENVESRVNQRAEDLTFFGNHTRGFAKEPSPKLTGVELTSDLVKDACSMHDLHVLQALTRRGISLLLPDLILSDQPVFVLLENLFQEWAQALIEVEKKVHLPLGVVRIADWDKYVSDIPAAEYKFARLENNFRYFSYSVNNQKTPSKVSPEKTYRLIPDDPFYSFGNNVQDLLECLGSKARDIWRGLDWDGKHKSYIKLKKMIEYTCEHLLAESANLSALESYELRALFMHVKRGETVMVERYLKKDKNLVYTQFNMKYTFYIRTTIRNISPRAIVLNGVTMFQIAFWEENRSLCDLILQYLPIEKAREQWQLWELSYINIKERIVRSRHDEHFYMKEHDDWYDELLGKLSDKNIGSSKNKQGRGK